MREVEVSRLTDVIEKLCIEANEHLPEDVKCAITGCRACEDGEIAKGVLDKNRRKTMRSQRESDLPMHIISESHSKR